MRILMTVPTPGIRGPLTAHTPVLLAHLRELGCDVTTAPWGRHRDDEGLGAKVAGRLSDVWRVRQKLRQGRFELMVVKTGHSWATVIRDAALLAATRGLVPRRVLQFHGGRAEYLGRPGRRLFKLFSCYLARASDGFLVLSSEEQRQWQAFAPGCPCEVVCNPFEIPEALASQPDQTQGPARPGELRLLFVGRLLREKGALEVIEAMPAILKEQACRLCVVGDGPTLSEGRQLAARLGLPDKVEFAGYLRGQALWQEYRKAAVFVLPTWWHEGFPTVIAEAMAAGLPIVTTSTRGAADHLQEGINASFVPARSPAAVAAAALRLLRDPELRHRMGAANREKVNDFSPRRVAANYFKALEQLSRC